jgi:hypothetical protein
MRAQARAPRCRPTQGDIDAQLANLAELRDIAARRKTTKPGSAKADELERRERELTTAIRRWGDGFHPV